MVMTFTASAFIPLALGFFGLGTGYLIYGPEELFHWPKRDTSVDKSTGIWGIWLPGFCQFMTGTYLFVGLTWFQVFKAAPLYMAALAFSAYGIHWFALGFNRWQGSDPRPNAGMSVAFTALSVLGLIVFFKASDWPVGLLFCGLTAVYVSDFVHSIGIKVGERALGFFHILTGLWLMYLTFAAVLDMASAMHLPL